MNGKFEKIQKDVLKKFFFLNYKYIICKFIFTPAQSISI